MSNNDLQMLTGGENLLLRRRIMASLKPIKRRTYIVQEQTTVVPETIALIQGLHYDPEDLLIRITSPSYGIDHHFAEAFFCRREKASGSGSSANGIILSRWQSGTIRLVTSGQDSYEWDSILSVGDVLTIDVLLTDNDL